ncbi:MAG: amidase [Actinomycetota bacterium]
MRGFAPMAQLYELGVRALRAALEVGEIAPVDAVDSCLERTAGLDDRLNSMIETREIALDEARAASGPLGGIPVAVKDMFVDRDRQPTCGSNVGGHWLRGTAEPLARLEAAGAVVLGYTNQHEWGLGMTSTVSAHGPVRNPWNVEHGAGGSSGGSAAAVATGFAPAAIGTDAGGSIRCPASLCGIVGLKPTWGRVPMNGFAIGEAAIDHIGPMARNVGDVRVLLEVMTGESFPREEVAPLRIGIARRHFFENLDPDFASALDIAIKEIEGLVAVTTEVDVVGAEAAGYGVGTLLLPHTAELLKDDLASRPEAFQPETLRLLELGAAMGEQDRTNGEIARALVTQAFDNVFGSVDVVLTPTMPAPPPRLDELTLHLPLGDTSPDIAYLPITGPMNLAGVPCLTLPVAVTPQGWSVGLSLTAGRGRDGVVLDLGEAIEEALGARYADRVAQP